VTRFLTLPLMLGAGFCLLGATHEGVARHRAHEAPSRKPHEVESREPHEAPSRKPHAVASHGKPATQAKRPKISTPKH